MIIYYYYDRAMSGKPMITHAFAIDGDEYARGTAVCSFGDNPCKKVGRKIAEERAIQSLKNKRSFLNDKPRTKHGHPWFSEFYKGYYMPEVLLPVEEKFIKNYKMKFEKARSLIK